MIRGFYRDGVIYPSEPVPSNWAEGEAVRVEPEHAEPSDDPAAIDRWDALWRQTGPMRYEQGERERFEAALEEADAIAKEQMRRRMESER